MLSEMAANNAGNTGDQRMAIRWLSIFAHRVTTLIVLRGPDQSCTTAPSLAADLTVASRMVMLLTRSSPVMG
jgi:hypothetical protein